MNDLEKVEIEVRLHWLKLGYKLGIEDGKKKNEERVKGIKTPLLFFAHFRIVMSSGNFTRINVM